MCVYFLLFFKDHYMQVDFGGDLTTAILVSPTFALTNRTSCLTFLYQMNGDSVRLYVNVTRADGNVETLLVKTFADQINYPSWSSAYVTMEAFQQIIFVADKFGYTAGSYSVFLDDITISDRQCLTGDIQL